jgi:hypothetical protein
VFGLHGQFAGAAAEAHKELARHVFLRAAQEVLE